MARILIVDDHPNIVRLLQATLAPEHEVLTAFNGEDALKLVAERHPEVILLDVVLPGIDGYAVLERVKSNPETAGTTVIMLTVKDKRADMLVGLAVGSDYYVPKPFDAKDVAALIRRHLVAVEGKAVEAGTGG
jgi:DNA-binding response OmpR family regulator